ncbi:hypothetical protein [Cupriavidus sp. H39]|uniref:hypothetical protein n=1 Tax=Cupriavidus sp. H39 TaxID=3401635 RepID=UPI003CFC0A88
MDGKGLLRVRGSVEEVTHRAGCSTATIYRCLARITEGNGAPRVLTTDASRACQANSFRYWMNPGRSAMRS